MLDTVQTTQEHILEAGKQEFLLKGFEKASLRQIAQAAGVTTGAIYGYYSDKEALFCALVEKPAEELYQRFLESQQNFDRFPLEKQAVQMAEYTMSEQEQLWEYIYQNKDAFRLVIGCSAGTRYAGYVDRLVEIEEEHTLRFAKSLQQSGKSSLEISPNVVHILCSAGFHGLFEIIAHDLPQEEAMEHLHVITAFYRAGWLNVLRLG